MTSTQFHVPSVEALADEYARTRKRHSRPVSMAAAIRAIRTLSPRELCSDKELANIIAACAIRYGHTVDFDLD